MQPFGGIAVFEDSVEQGAAALHHGGPKAGAAHGGCSGDGKCGREDSASLLSLRLARERRSSEKVFNLLSHIMQEPQTALLIGTGAGIAAVFHYGLTARDHGAGMRGVLPRLYASAVPNLYVCGGASIFRGVLDSVSRYHAREGVWESMPPMPTARRLCAAATVAGSLYIVGGEYEEPAMWYSDSAWRQYKQLSTAECFNAFAGQWETLEDMPTARAGCAGAALAGMVYVFGGRIAENVRATAERLDVALGRWERLPGLPTGRSGCAAAPLLGMLYVLGGKGSDGEILGTVERFDAGRGWWQVLPPMPMPRSAAACGAVGGRLFVAGGFNGVEGVEHVDAFDPAVGVWESQAPMQTWRIGAATAVASGRLYVLGGKTGGDHALRCECLDPPTGVWTWLPGMPERHVYCAGGAVVGYT